MPEERGREQREVWWKNFLLAIFQKGGALPGFWSIK
jgi:hypothetical protein